MPGGFLGTRANLLVDVVLVINIIAPFWAYGAARLARRGEHKRHQVLQVALCVLMFACLFALEGMIRFSGGSGSLVANSPHAGTTLLKVAFLLHIGPAVVVYAVWLGLVITSLRRRPTKLPGTFSRRHRQLGWFVFVGLVWIALSAIVVYGLGFVAAA